MSHTEIVMKGFVKYHPPSWVLRQLVFAQFSVFRKTFLYVLAVHVFWFINHSDVRAQENSARTTLVLYETCFGSTETQSLPKNAFVTNLF